VVPLQPVRIGLSELDSVLVERTKAGDPYAFEELVHRHSDGLYALVRRLGLPHESAEEVVQETFLRAWRGIGRFRADSQFFTWLYRIALNEARRELRRRARARLSSLEEDGVREPADPRPAPQALVEQKELRVALAHAIGALRLKYRAPLVLRDVEGLSTIEAAAILGLSEAACKSRLHRARVALHKVLETETESSRVGQPPGAA